MNNIVLKIHLGRHMQYFIAYNSTTILFKTVQTNQKKMAVKFQGIAWMIPTYWILLSCNNIKIAILEISL